MKRRFLIITLMLKLAKLGSTVVLTGNLLVLQKVDQNSRQRKLLHIFPFDQLLNP